MTIKVETYSGNNSNKFKKHLAELRIKVFREYPYLYDGNIEYEEKYIDTFMKSEENLIVVAFDNDKIIGVSTALPLRNETYEIQKPWIENQENIDKIFYFSESVLLPEYRKKGIGKEFYNKRELWAKKTGYELVVFCGVIREENHPDKPKNYEPLEKYWIRKGYRKKDGYTCKISWKEINEKNESNKVLQFWYKQLNLSENIN